MRNISDRDTGICGVEPDADRETKEILSEPDTVAEIRESEEDIAAGRVTDAEDLRDAMIARRRGA